MTNHDKNFLMLMIDSYLLIAFNYPGGKKFYLGLHFAIQILFIYKEKTNFRKNL